MRNSQVRSSVRTSWKKLINYLESRDEKDATAVETMYRDFVKKIDTAAGKGIYHKNNVARKKSRMAKRIKTTFSAQS